MNDMNVAVSYITLGTQLIANGSISVEIDHYDGMKQLWECLFSLILQFFFQSMRNSRCTEPRRLLMSCSIPFAHAVH